ncbi:hypothetical protein C8Q76DRAFT_768688 [Earliella scabrosa]|nr:hypothetical protein C8Q76DRAFT_768688 [Earliella scabrosa]
MAEVSGNASAHSAPDQTAYDDIIYQPMDVDPSPSDGDEWEDLEDADEQDEGVQIRDLMGLRHPDPFAIEVLDIYSLARTTNVCFSGALTHAAALVMHGYLPTVPELPNLAISIKTLELLRCLKLFKPSFSIEVFAKLLCHYYIIPYRRTIRSALADTFDVYLEILRIVKKRVLGALGRDDPHWRACLGCPACGYELYGEAPREFTRMFCMDGNSSLKRVGEARVFDESDYFLPQKYVDRFANEPFVEGDPTDGSPDIESTCTKNWKAAAADDKKRTWDIFEETGIFASACRHAIILWIIDMVRSGELAKLPLATCSKAMEELGPGWLCGFDVGCSFNGTISRSSLGPRFAQLGCRICVNAFHGYSHAYSCQVRHHPNVIKGTGLEDLETMERIFSFSNQLAPIIRYTTAYRHRVLIDQHFQHWDEDRSRALGTFLYNNFIQAIDIIKKKTPIIEDGLRALRLTADDLRGLAADEAAYLDTVGKEDPRNVYAVAYVEALEDLRKVNEQLRSIHGAFLKNAPSIPLTFEPPQSGPINYDEERSKTAKTETNRRYLNDRHKTLSLEIVEMEVALGVEITWQPSDPEYLKTMEWINTRRYQRALADLQRLVVQRLFELHKMNLSQTGYRVRRHIAKSLQTRSRAIRNALKKYNTATKALTPPRPTLDWSSFELLNNTRADLRGQRWAEPAVREAMRQSLRLERAREELRNVGVEAGRVHTAIRDEELLFAAVLEDLIRTRDPLFGAVADYILYTGSRVPGMRAGAPLPALITHANLDMILGTDDETITQTEVDEGQEDHAESMFSALTDFIAELHV